MAMATLSTYHAILADTGCDPKVAWGGLVS
jgi:hypothetical protein